MKSLLAALLTFHAAAALADPGYVSGPANDDLVPMHDGYIPIGSPCSVQFDEDRGIAVVQFASARLAKNNNAENIRRAGFGLSIDGDSAVVTIPGLKRVTTGIYAENPADPTQQYFVDTSVASLDQSLPFVNLYLDAPSGKIYSIRLRNELLTTEQEMSRLCPRPPFERLHRDSFERMRERYYACRLRNHSRSNEIVLCTQTYKLARP